ncbi:MAG: NADH-quinone oxidoreductase subunit L, partial [Pseudomonadota bacterium]
GMVFFHQFFGHADRVATFYGIPYAEAADHGNAQAAEEHSASNGETAHSADAHGGGEGHGDKHHYVFTGQPGEGALYIAPDNTVLEDAHEVPKWVKVSPFLAMLAGLALAYLFYIRRPDLPGRLAQNQHHLYQFLLHKWYFDELYDAIIVRPARSAGEILWRRGDGNVIDGGINGLAMGLIPFFTRLAGRAQSGYLFHYAFAMVLGIVVIILFLMLAGA